eukprot:2967198-Prymnesium_polylepis.1
MSIEQPLSLGQHTAIETIHEELPGTWSNTFRAASYHACCTAEDHPQRGPNGRRRILLGKCNMAALEQEHHYPWLSSTSQLLHGPRSPSQPIKHLQLKPQQVASKPSGGPPPPAATRAGGQVHGRQLLPP